MDILIMAGQLILGLTILVGVHEMGHMLSAKWFGMRVEKFAIGFPPKLFGKKIGETEYMIGAVPLGGFVKITGMIDESLDTEAMSQEPQPYEFRAKPAWQRLIVMLGGIIVNVLTGILIFTILTAKYGQSYLPASEVRFGVVPSKLGEEIGFRKGDKIVKINGRPFEQFDDVYDPDVVMGNQSYYTVERNGQLLDIKLPTDFMDRLADNQKDPARFVEPLNPFEVGEVVAGRAAAKAGLQPGDRILRVGNQEINFFPELQQALKDNAGKATALLVQRNSQPITITANIEDEGTLGFMPKSLLQYSTKDYNFFEAIPAGASQAFGIVSNQVQAFGKIFRGEASASKSLGGPMAIAQTYGGTFNWIKFWTLTGMLSMVLAFMNLLPIPALDGGHVMFLTYEMVSGRKPSDKFLENSQKVGMALLLSLMVFVIFNDLFKTLF
ncbi:RIP metalloprotease RseP [Hymenobacter roseosalivarius]|nr:RIP metalloprotease RseP [Hymenobacter roseosalivarius]